jgi:hypothetical protein
MSGYVWGHSFGGERILIDAGKISLVLGVKEANPPARKKRGDLVWSSFRSGRKIFRP